MNAEPLRNDPQSQAEHRQFIVILATVIFATLAAVFAINALVDPLWYLSGNRLTPRNFTWNERLSKTNLILQNSQRFDCIIFGSSRTALLNHNLIAGYRCFNFSLSGGKVHEFVPYARYLKAFGFAPRLIIVGADEFSFSAPPGTAPDAPSFVLDGLRPPSILQSYLTADVLRFSVRTLMDDSPMPRYYRPDFTGDHLPFSHRYDPASAATMEFAHQNPAQGSALNLGYYDELVAAFPEARWIGFVPPVSAWEVAALDANGRLDDYLGVVYRLSRRFSAFFDFAVPSALTTRTDNTVDGTHYDMTTNDLIAHSVSTGYPAFGVRVDELTEQAYRQAYRRALETILAERRLAPWTPAANHKNDEKKD